MELCAQILANKPLSLSLSFSLSILYLDIHACGIGLWVGHADAAQLGQHLRQHLRLLGRPLTQDIDVDESARDVHDFKSKVDAVTLAYEGLIEQTVIAAVERHPDTLLAPLAPRDAAKAEMDANTLYMWARAFVPADSTTSARTHMAKADKIKMMPYVVAMAYAVRLKLDVYCIESSGMDDTERMMCSEMSRKAMGQLMQVLQVATWATIDDSSLLDMALDYHLATTTYITLSAAVRASVQMAMPTLGGVPRAIVHWDDGLSGIRCVSIGWEAGECEL